MRSKIIAAILLLGCPQMGFCTLVAEKKGMSSIIKKIQEEESLSVIGMSRIDPGGKCSLSFKGASVASHPEARKLIVEVLEKFREQFNERWELYSRVEGGSIDTQNIEVAIDFEPKTEGSISRVVHRDGKLYYTFSNAQQQEESYTEALRLVYGVPLDLAKKLIANGSKKG